MSEQFWLGVVVLGSMTVMLIALLVFIARTMK